MSAQSPTRVGRFGSSERTDVFHDPRATVRDLLKEAGLGVNADREVTIDGRRANLGDRVPLGAEVLELQRPVKG